MSSPGKRIDLHCHSDASNKTSEAVLNAIHCPESYSHPREVYNQAKRRGMDFVTLTDHDTIDGALTIADRADVIVGEELSCWFPEDNCKLHLLIYGIYQTHHDALQSRARDIYDVADYIEQNAIAHAVAHPIYRQNDKLERWHLERLLLLFKGFECLNGAHSALHREAFEPLLDRLTSESIARLSETHDLRPRWKSPWIKSRVAGSDDHGLLNVGRTWTLLPDDAKTPADVLNCLREGRCAPSGESGSSAKLAHTFYSVAVRYYTRHMLEPGAMANLATTILQTLAGERGAPTKTEIAGFAIKHKLRKIGRKIISPFARREKQSEGTGIIKRLFLNSARDHMDEHPDLFKSIEQGLPPLGEHAQMFDFVNKINRDVTRGIAAAIAQSLDRASFTGLFDSIAAILAQQFVLLPYYFAVFHQNKERHLLRKITGLEAPIDARTIKVGLFTDTFDEVNGVARFVRDMGARAGAAGLNFAVHTSVTDLSNSKSEIRNSKQSIQDRKGNQVNADSETRNPKPETRNPASAIQNPKSEIPNESRVNFIPLLVREMPYYRDLSLNLPPVLEILEWADRQQFDVIHVSTPGPMGLVGWLVSKMLRVPMIATYHTDFPAYVEKFTGDHRVANATSAYMKWFYSQASAVFVRSAAYRFKLMDLGIEESRLRTLPAGVDTERFNSTYRDVNHFAAMGITQSKRLLYAGRVSVEKNLPLLVETFRKLCAQRRDVALIVAGDGPYLDQMKQALADLPATFLGVQNDAQLAKLYASADLFVFPSRTDTLGQVVMEAQACGLPAIVSSEGGPKETVVDDATGRVLTSNDAADWCDAINALLNDEPRRQHMSLAAIARMARFSLNRSFDAFWAEHLLATTPPVKINPSPVMVEIAPGATVTTTSRASKQPAGL